MYIEMKMKNENNFQFLKKPFPVTENARRLPLLAFVFIIFNAYGNDDDGWEKHPGSRVKCIDQAEEKKMKKKNLRIFSAIDSRRRTTACLHQLQSNAM